MGYALNRMDRAMEGLEESVRAVRLAIISEREEYEDAISSLEEKLYIVRAHLRGECPKEEE